MGYWSSSLRADDFCFRPSKPSFSILNILSCHIDYNSSPPQRELAQLLPIVSSFFKKRSWAKLTSSHETMYLKPWFLVGHMLQREYFQTAKVDSSMPDVICGIHPVHVIKHINFHLYARTLSPYSWDIFVRMNKVAKYQRESVNLIKWLLPFIYGAPIVYLALRWLQSFKDKIKHS